MEKEIEKQLEFVEWLKSQGLYNPMETASTMVKLQAVYDKLEPLQVFAQHKHGCFGDCTCGLDELLNPEEEK